MKTMINLLCILTALWLTGCYYHERGPRAAVVVEPPPVVVYDVPYDDPGRGWYIEGYYGPGGIYIAPFWTFDITIVHRHFDHYRGHYRTHFQDDFRRHPDRYRYENRGREEYRERGGYREGYRGEGRHEENRGEGRGEGHGGERH